MSNSDTNTITLTLPENACAAEGLRTLLAAVREFRKIPRLDFHHAREQAGAAFSNPFDLDPYIAALGSLSQVEGAIEAALEGRGEAGHDVLSFPDKNDLPVTFDPAHFRARRSASYLLEGEDMDTRVYFFTYDAEEGTVWRFFANHEEAETWVDMIPHGHLGELSVLSPGSASPALVKALGFEPVAAISV